MRAGQVETPEALGGHYYTPLTEEILGREPMGGAQFTVFGLPAPYAAGLGQAPTVPDGWGKPPMEDKLGGFLATLGCSPPPGTRHHRK